MNCCVCICRVRHGVALTSSFNFENFANSFIVLVYVLVGVWSELQHDLSVSEPRCTWDDDDSKNDCGCHVLVVSLYFFTYIVFASYIFIDLFVAVVLEVTHH